MNLPAGNNEKCNQKEKEYQRTMIKQKRLKAYPSALVSLQQALGNLGFLVKHKSDIAEFWSVWGYKSSILECFGLNGTLKIT